MSNLRTHAERELRAQGMDPEGGDDPNTWMARSILELIDTFAAQGHSGMSAPYCIAAFAKLAAFEPLGPLTGADSEWNEVGSGVWQNNRCSTVFKEADGRAYNFEGRVFCEPSGQKYINQDSRVYIQFPYTPATEVVHVPALEGRSDD